VSHWAQRVQQVSEMPFRLSNRIMASVFVYVGRVERET